MTTTARWKSSKSLLVFLRATWMLPPATNAIKRSFFIYFYLLPFCFVREVKHQSRGLLDALSMRSALYRIIQMRTVSVARKSKKAKTFSIMNSRSAAVDKEIRADGINKAGWGWGCVSALDSNGRTIWIVDAHSDGKRFIVRSDEKLTAFLELERAVCINV